MNNTPTEVTGSACSAMPHNLVPCSLIRINAVCESPELNLAGQRTTSGTPLPCCKSADVMQQHQQQCCTMVASIHTDNSSMKTTSLQNQH
jgi:hypothetical protein